MSNYPILYARLDECEKLLIEANARNQVLAAENLMLSTEFRETRAMLEETRTRNYRLADENFQLRQILKLANEQVLDLMKKFDKLEKDMGYD